MTVLSLVLGLWLLWPVRPARAHSGGVLYLSNAVAGNYELSVWVAPQVVTTAAPAHFAILVLEPAVDGQSTQEFVLDADVRVRATPPPGGAGAREQRASRLEADNELFYETEMDLASSGDWEIEILVEGPDGAGAGSFMLPVEREGGLTWYILGGTAVVIVLAGFFVWRSRPPQDDD